ncbi:MAG: M23 family metallopeptidase, partial [Calditrichia bacterium]
RCKEKPFFIKRKEGEWFAVIVFSGATFLFASLLVFTLMGFSFSGDSVELLFPLKNGNYYIAQGGNSPLINIHHHPQSPLKFAIDISKLYPLGNRAGGIYPDELEKYAIYGDTVYSPCDAMVLQVEDGHPDSPVSEPDTLNFKGNFVKLQCGKVNVYLAHFIAGSIVVQSGDSVIQGQPIARVGNSGFSTEPHLHIHAEVEDSTAFMGRRPVAILFNGKFLVRNDLLQVKQQPQ